MKDGNWIALHKELRYFLPSGREYTILEAMFSYTIDIDNGRDGTVSGYSKLWGWSRTKVRKFIEELKTGEGHLTNRQRTGKRHQVLLKLNNLQDQKDTLKTGKKQVKDTLVDTTIKPNPKPNPKPRKTFLSDSIEYRLSKYLLDEIRKNNSDHKEPSLQSWSKHIDLLLRVDGKQSQDVGRVIKWCQGDSFWQSNILSTKKLREKYDQLIIKMNSKPKSEFKTKEQRSQEAKDEFLNGTRKEKVINP
jgi:hypothetical protein